MERDSGIRTQPHPSLSPLTPLSPPGLKQLKWESKRDDWVHGRDAQTLRKKKTAFNKKKDFVKAKVAGKAKMAKKVFKKKK